MGDLTPKTGDLTLFKRAWRKYICQRMCIGRIKHGHGALAIDMTDNPVVGGKANQFL